MDARKVHELFLSQYEQNARGTTPATKNIYLKNTENSLTQNPKPAQLKSNIDGIKWGRIVFWGGALLVTYLLISAPTNNTSSSFFQRRKLREKESSNKDKV